MIMEGVTNDCPAFIMMLLVDCLVDVHLFLSLTNNASKHYSHSKSRFMLIFRVVQCRFLRAAACCRLVLVQVLCWVSLLNKSPILFIYLLIYLFINK